MTNWPRGRTQNKVINDEKDWKTADREEHKIMWSMIRMSKQLNKGRTQNNGMNDKKDWETEQGEEHKIMWSMIRKTGKLTKGKNTK